MVITVQLDTEYLREYINFDLPEAHKIVRVFQKKVKNCSL